MVERILQFIRNDPHYKKEDVEIVPKSRLSRFSETLSFLAIHKMSISKTKRFESYTFLPFSTQESITVDVTGEDSELKLHPKKTKSEKARKARSTNKDESTKSGIETLSSKTERRRQGTRCNWAILVFIMVLFWGYTILWLIYGPK